MVGRVAYADVEVGEGVGLDHVAQDHVETATQRRTLDSFRHFGCHARVEFDCYALFRLFQNLDREVTTTRADFENGVGLLEVGFVDDGLGYAGVLEDVLTEVCVHFEDCIGLTGRGVGVGTTGFVVG